MNSSTEQFKQKHDLLFARVVYNRIQDKSACNPVLWWSRTRMHFFLVLMLRNKKYCYDFIFAGYRRCFNCEILSYPPSILCPNCPNRILLKSTFHQHAVLIFFLIKPWLVPLGHSLVRATFNRFIYIYIYPSCYAIYYNVVWLKICLETFTLCYLCRNCPLLEWESQDLKNSSKRSLIIQPWRGRLNHRSSSGS